MQKSFWDKIPKKEGKGPAKQPAKQPPAVPDSVYEGELKDEPVREREEYRPKWGPAGQTDTAPPEDTRSAALPEGVDLLDSLIGGPAAPAAATELEKLLNDGTTRYSRALIILLF